MTHSYHSKINTRNSTLEIQHSKINTRTQIRHQVDMTFEKLRQSIRIELENELDRPEKDKKQNEEDSDHSNEPTELTKRMMSCILRNVEFSLRRLQPLVRSGTSLLARAELGRVFADLVQGQMRHFFLWFNEIVRSVNRSWNFTL